MNTVNSQSHIPVFYCPEMVAESGSFSPSAAKPGKVVERWQRRGLPIRVERPEPVTEETLCLSHDPAYVRGVLAREIDNGFGNRRADVAASLPWTTGAMLSAARAAIQARGVTCAPCSGFHHARYRAAAGFCTFNGLMVTATALLREGAKKIGILDADMHYGDGTDDIIGTLDLRRRVHHITIGQTFTRPSQAATFLNQLPDIIATFKDCDVLLYQAGADPHIDDPLGGWLTTDQLLARDRAVFQAAAHMGLPLTWNLAGGYQVAADGSIDPVLLIHENTMHACAETYGSPPSG